MRSKQVRAVTASQRGWSLAEWSVSQALALLGVAAAFSLWQTQQSKQRTIETREQAEQSLRLAGAQLVQQLRRAQPRRAGATGESVHCGPVRLESFTDRSPILWFIPGTAGEVSEQEAGLRLSNASLQLRLPNAHWQALTDPSTLRVLRLEIFPLGSAELGASDCPSPSTRGLSIRIEAELTQALPTLTPDLRWEGTVALRNASQAQEF